MTVVVTTVEPVQALTRQPGRRLIMEICKATRMCEPAEAASPSWRLALSGGLAGMLTNTILHPLDTVKTVRQADPKSFHGVWPTMLTLIQTRGIPSLYAGIAPALIGSALSSALYFATYERAKTALNAIKHAAPKRVIFTALAAACGNVASSLLFVPKEVVKQRMQVASAKSSDFFSVATGVWKTYGLRGLYQGYKATLLRNIPSTMLRFVIYEELKVRFRRFNAARGGRRFLSFSGDWVDISPGQLVIAGALAGALASSITTPMDVLKTRFATGAFPPRTSIPSALTSIIRDHGISGLYVGIRPRALWAALFAGIGFSTYEACKAWILPSNPVRKHVSHLMPWSDHSTQVQTR